MNLTGPHMSAAHPGEGVTLWGVGTWVCDQWGMNYQLSVTQCGNQATPLTFQINRADVGDFRPLMVECMRLFLAIHKPCHLIDEHHVATVYTSPVARCLSSANVCSLLLSIKLQQTASC